MRIRRYCLRRHRALEEYESDVPGAAAYHSQGSLVFDAARVEGAVEDLEYVGGGALCALPACDVSRLRYCRLTAGRRGRWARLRDR